MKILHVFGDAKAVDSWLRTIVPGPNVVVQYSRSRIIGPDTDIMCILVTRPGDVQFLRGMHFDMLVHHETYIPQKGDTIFLRSLLRDNTSKESS